MSDAKFTPSHFPESDERGPFAEAQAAPDVTAHHLDADISVVIEAPEAFSVEEEKKELVAGAPKDDFVTTAEAIKKHEQKLIEQGLEGFIVADAREQETPDSASGLDNGTLASGAAAAAAVSQQRHRAKKSTAPKGGASGGKQGFLFLLLLLAVAGLAWTGFAALRDSRASLEQVRLSGQALTQSQRLVNESTAVVHGNTGALPDVVDSAQALGLAVQSLNTYGAVQAWGGWGKARTATQRSIENANAMTAQKEVIVGAEQSLRRINEAIPALQEAVEEVMFTKLQRNAPAVDIAAVGQLEVLTLRIAKASISEEPSGQGNESSANALERDLALFADIADGLLQGNASLRISAAGEPKLQAQVREVIRHFNAVREPATFIANNSQKLAAVRAAQADIVKDGDPLRVELEQLQQHLSAQTVFTSKSLALFAGLIVAIVLIVLMLFAAQAADSRRRRQETEKQRQRALAQEAEVRRANEAVQTAILRLMNELQNIAEGDLTQETTVTEDITGAIADSVNSTVEELRQLVSHVQEAVDRVRQTTEQVENASADLLATSNEQLREIHETGQSVLDMATRIQNMSTRAQESASVARQSLQAAETLISATEASIGGMNTIREQIQDTAKRIKRLGESSQEIGEITELISDITEQTNVLALNAAIQAAAAGDAGRGFSVVAEEVQRLAERSADATKQISALVKAIQTDTQDAVEAMERSTKGVVEGARLSDNAGAALAKIDAVTRNLARLIEQISASALRESNMATGLADNIQHIFAVTEQTSDSTRVTSQQVQELSSIAEELRQSVARFKIT